MQITVTKEAFYNQQIVKPGRQIEFTGEEAPSWGVPIGEEAKKEGAKTPDAPVVKVGDLPDAEQTALKAQANAVGIKGNLKIYSVENLKTKIAEAEEAKKEGALKEQLEALITEAETLEITFEADETKSIQEQIDELTADIATKKG